MKVKEAALKSEVESMRAQRDALAKKVEASGWKVPLPERKIGNSAVRM